MTLAKLIETYNCSGYTDRAIASEVGVNVRTFRKWVACDQTPNNKSMKKIEEMIEIMSRTPPFPATPATDTQPQSRSNVSSR